VKTAETVALETLAISGVQLNVKFQNVDATLKPTNAQLEMSTSKKT
jgi:hypothetical protein